MYEEHITEHAKRTKDYKSWSQAQRCDIQTRGNSYQKCTKMRLHFQPPETLLTIFNKSMSSKQGRSTTCFENSPWSQAGLGVRCLGPVIKKLSTNENRWGQLINQISAWLPNCIKKKNSVWIQRIAFPHLLQKTVSLLYLLFYPHRSCFVLLPQPIVEVPLLQQSPPLLLQALQSKDTAHKNDCWLDCRFASSDGTGNQNWEIYCGCCWMHCMSCD